MSDHKNHLDHAYKLETVDATRDFYADWAATYDAEIVENGYATPARCAQAVAKFASADALILDTGCGTGLSGLALKAAGFSKIDGCDITQEMLAGAQDRGLYRNLWLSDPNAPLDISRGPYNVIAAIGVIGNGAAPISFFHEIVRKMASDSYFVFSFNDKTLADRQYEATLSNVVDSGGYNLLFREYGPHFPKRNMNSNVYVLHRL